MKKLFLFLSVSLLALAPAGAQTQQSAPARQQVIGEVTAVDAAARTVTVRSDSGETVTLSTTEQTTYTRMPQGVTDPLLLKHMRQMMTDFIVANL